MVFRSSGSPMDEMKWLDCLRQRDPESATNVILNGKLMVEYARKGQLRALQCAVEHMQEIFRAACRGLHVPILKFMLANGFDLQQTCMRDIVHSVVENISDQSSAEAAQPLIRFLLDAGIDVNAQRKGDFYTALHIACRKNLFAIANLLVIYGADVNSIAQNDEMPLSIAEQCTDRCTMSANMSEENQKLIAFLKENYAKSTWRKQGPATAQLCTATSANRNSSSTSATTTTRMPILRFSSAFNVQLTAENDENADDSEKYAAMFAGITLGTPM